MHDKPDSPIAAVAATVGKAAFNLCGWLYLARVSLLGLAIFAGLPLLTRGGARTLAVGAFDLYDFQGALLAGVLLPVAAWMIFLSGALVFTNGKDRTRFDIGDVPAWFRLAFRLALWAAIALNVWTICAASDAPDRSVVMGGVFAGLILGAVIVVVAEWLQPVAAGSDLHLFALFDREKSMPPDPELPARVKQWEWL